jgi:hypothetical protein
MIAAILANPLLEFWVEHAVRCLLSAASSATVVWIAARAWENP